MGSQTPLPGTPRGGVHRPPICKKKPGTQWQNISRPSKLKAKNRVSRCFSSTNRQKNTCEIFSGTKPQEREKKLVPRAPWKSQARRGAQDPSGGSRTPRYSASDRIVPWGCSRPEAAQHHVVFAGASTRPKMIQSLSDCFDLLTATMIQVSSPQET